MLTKRKMKEEERNGGRKNNKGRKSERERCIKTLKSSVRIGRSQGGNFYKTLTLQQNLNTSSDLV